MNRKKLLAVVGALVLAMVCTAALVRYVQGAKDRALSGEELVEVLVAKTSIKAGTAAADLVKDVTAEQVQTKVRAADAITSFSQIDGLVTAIDLVAGEQLLSTRFVNPASFQGARSSSVKIPVGANEVTFKLSPERALGGQLRPGDTVTAVASFEPFDNDALNPATGEPALSHIRAAFARMRRREFASREEEEEILASEEDKRRFSLKGDRGSGGLLAASRKCIVAALASLTLLRKSPGPQSPGITSRGRPSAPRT